eukprot:CAMPEP_0119319036 /NCGR_PEP_ID=MMETSP1333-20130426/48318_1 /TAXON_ID=418940 /ORGANISM="Scyphosphaera apsteinii, Strain RCC1455" /LENGTH=188 /DNA_ID=CAMNT_0007325357 /DNA_START=193 /DNA_END=759 /DNA_ORIENTATION=-
MAGDLSDAERAAIHAQADAIFSVIDINADGMISRSELGGHLTRAGYTAAAVSSAFGKLDLNSDGTISRAEMREAFILYEPLRTAPGLGWGSQTIAELHHEASDIFDAIDVNGNGEISLVDLKRYLSKAEEVGYSAAAIKNIFEALDDDSSGGISREEMRQGYVQHYAMQIALGLKEPPDSYPIRDPGL